ncbi:hydratase [Leisingera aquaemixtae]|uniref:MaoC/PaaZ C-terminal domain-containing protein n=1 Tax=Leisingera aquaemixtae TaxID=1396826 RepID=UPI001C94108C|nr:MaoC/PaaZ C-terminal domain-containing protein [Leisingera aquaemixtae]MBY6068524.1 hydratase [Leisingera aquaemixtae]
MIDLQEYWTPTQTEFDAFADVSGDDNAIHVDPGFCASTAFGRTVSHGMLIYSKLWGMLKRHNGAIAQVSQSLMFPNPAFAGEELSLRIAEQAPGRLKMSVIRVADGAECLVGEAKIRC